MTRSSVSSIAIMTMMIACQSVGAQDDPPANGRIQFAFDRTPWGDVVQWLADSADLALQIGDLPTGSFTYSDSHAYSPDEAIDRVNLFLIPHGFSVVRSGRLMSVISVNDEVSLKQLDAMAESVRPEQLATLPTHSLVKCLFPLHSIDPSLALQELSALRLMREPILLRDSAQIYATDIVSNLRTVQQVLSRLAERANTTGPVTAFLIGHADSEEVLALVRPHVGLAAAANLGADISLSVDTSGRQILASGSPENIAKVAGVIKLLHAGSATSANIAPEFRTHPLGTADVEAVTNVLQTLLADENVRLSVDPNSNQLAVLASRAVHDRVARTIEDLADTNAVKFKAIPVRLVDLRYAAMVVRQLFTPDSSTEAVDSSQSRHRPTIDIDWINSRLFVRARPDQIAQMEIVLHELENPSPSESESGFQRRLLPYSGERGRRILDAARQFWPFEDELQIVPSVELNDIGPIEREINMEPLRKTDSRDGSELHIINSDQASVTDSSIPTALASSGSQNIRPSTDATRVQSIIHAQLTPRGILVHSTDPDAVRRFEEHLELIAGPANTKRMKLAVFYLKHALVDDASRLLRQILSTEADAMPFPSGALENTNVNLDSLRLTDSVDQEGIGRHWSVGAATIIPDQRLNRVFVYAAPSDLAKIETHLEVIDRESSLAAAIKTFGMPHVIELHNVRAEFVATIIRDAYAGRIGDTADERRQAAVQRREQPTGDQNSKQRSPTPQLADDTGESPQMTLAVDSQGNSLIVTAPDQLAAEVRDLALRLDERSQQAIHVIPISGIARTELVKKLSGLVGDRSPGESLSRSKTPAEATGR